MCTTTEQQIRDEGLPMSPEQKREWANNMLAMADKNPIAQAWFDVPSNQELVL